MTVAKLPIPNSQCICTTKLMALRGNHEFINRTRKQNSVSGRSKIPAIMIPQISNSKFIHTNAKNPQYAVSDVMTNEISTTKEHPTFKGKTLNSKFMRKTFDRRFMVKGMNPNIMAARAVTSRAIFSKVPATNTLPYPSLALVPRTSQKIVRKKSAFPRALRDDEALLPFRLIPSAAEERPLETSIP